MKIIFINLWLLIVVTASAQNEYTVNPAPKHKIWITATRGELIKGILVGISDSAVNIFPGKFSEWNNRSKISVITQPYLNIANIETHKKGGLIRGLLIGAGIGAAPVLIGSLFGRSVGEGGAYVSLVTFPVGIIAGAIIGSTSKKKFFIGGERAGFNSFRKRMK